MYNDTNAVWACRAVDALQNNWFPSPIAGLYSYLDWNGFDGFWQNGVVLETLANFVAYTRSRRYESVLLAAWRSIDDLLHAYFPLPSCDDELWFALAFARIYEVTGQVRFLNTSQQLLNFTWHTCWDFTGTCSGGMFFGDGHRIKITITNAQTLLLAAKLYRLTSHDEHLHQALQVAAYLTNNQVLHADSHLVSDELDVTSCQPNARTNYSYNAGMTLAGLTELYKSTNRTSVLQLAHAVARANIAHLSRDGVLTEYCDPLDSCAADLDAHAFKGIFVRSLRYLMDVSSPQQRRQYQAWIQLNIDHVIKHASCGDARRDVTNCNISFIDGAPDVNATGPVFDTNWAGNYTRSSPASQTQVLDLLTAGIRPDVVCSDDVTCNYDPGVAPIKRLTCADDPCPSGQACCDWGNAHKYYTCCARYQYCYDGGCY